MQEIDRTVQKCTWHIIPANPNVQSNLKLLLRNVNTRNNSPPNNSLNWNHGPYFSTRLNFIVYLQNSLRNDPLAKLKCHPESRILVHGRSDSPTKEGSTKTAVCELLNPQWYPVKFHTEQIFNFHHQLRQSGKLSNSGNITTRFNPEHTSSIVRNFRTALPCTCGWPQSTNLWGWTHPFAHHAGNETIARSPSWSRNRSSWKRIHRAQCKF